MLETLKQSIIINFSITLNSLIYFLKRIPLVKNLFRNTSYEHERFTTTLYILGLIYHIMNQILKSALSLSFSFGVVLIILRDKLATIDLKNLYFEIFVIFYLLLPLSSGKIVEPNKRKFISVKLMSMNATKFVIADYFPQLLLKQIVELVLFAIVADLYHVNLALALFLVVAKNFFALFIELLHIKYYDITSKFLFNKTGCILLYVAIVLAAGYVVIFNMLIFELPIFVPLVLGILCILVGSISLRLLLHYKNFALLINDANQLEKLSVDRKQASTNAQFRTVKLKEKEFSKEELSRANSNKEGFAYINEIFFQRHHRILNRSITVESIIIIVVIIGCVIASFLVPDFKSIYHLAMKKVTPGLVFVLYLMSNGQKATKAMFYNCDISLLHYGFYKKKDAVLKTFTVRVKNIIASNLIPAMAIATGILLLEVINGGTITTQLPAALMAIVLSVFFSIHNLFLYYIFQPYTTDLMVKNPMYKALNIITYWLCYVTIQIDEVPVLFLFLVTGITFAYCIIALLIVYRISPKTFVIK